MENQVFYVKEGRKYKPVRGHWYEADGDTLPVGTFRLTYCYGNGARRYEYDVTPATAPMMAAAMIAKQAMIEEIVKQSKMRPSTPVPYTKKQLAAIERFKEEMGGMFPTWWTENSAHAIADAAINAVLNWKP